LWRAAIAVISGLVLASSAGTLLAVGGIAIARSFHAFEAETDLMLRLLQLMFPYMILVCLAAVLIGMSNARGHFFVPALGSVILNVIMIGSVYLLAPRMGKALEVRIFGLAVGVVLAGLAQAFFQLPSLSKEGFRYEWVSPWNDPTVRDVVRKMLPGSIGVAAFQINVLVTQCFSFWFEPSIVSTFNYSVRLMELPQGMFGISLATYLLPTLSGLAAEKKYPEFRETLGHGLGYLAFVNLFAAAISAGLAEPIVRLLFERGQFGPEATTRVAWSLFWLAPGLLMFSMNNIFARAFYALNDIQTPMRISVLCLFLNLGFALWLIHPYQERGLGVANTLTATLNLGLLAYSLRRKLARLELANLRKTLLVLVPTAVLTALLAAYVARYWDRQLGHGTLFLKIGHVFVPAAVAGMAYWILAIQARIPAAREILHLLSRRDGAGGGNKT
jgi:putative peptidoglycan lipid II flippase